VSDFLAKYAPWLLLIAPLVGFWLRRRGTAQAPARGRIRAAQRKAAGERARVEAETAAAAEKARSDAANAAAGDEAAVVQEYNRRRGRK